MICFNNNTPMPGILTFVFTVQDAGGPAYLSATTWLITSFIPSLLFFPSPPPSILSDRHPLLQCLHHCVHVTQTPYRFSNHDFILFFFFKSLYQLGFEVPVDTLIFFCCWFFFPTLTNIFARSAVWCLIYEDN